MKTWLITGCSSGIGRGIAEAALAAGDQVIVTARNMDKIRDYGERYPHNALLTRLDLTDQDSMEKTVEEGIEHFGTIDVLVNNAGYGYRAAIEESQEDEVKTMFETNVYGPARLMNLVLPHMRKQRNGMIINVSSIGGVRAAVGNGWYSASKAALEMVSEAVAKESSPLGIQVMIVEPGAFRTHFYDSLEQSDLVIHDYDATVEAMRLTGKVSHEQPGDPKRAGKLIVSLVHQGSLPSRLPLGSDAVKIIDDTLRERLTELNDVRKYSVQTDFEK